MNKLTRNQASIIFKARARMLDVKGNYKNKYQDNRCRQCQKEEETQNHVLAECERTRETNNTITTQELFEEDPEKLMKTAKRIEVIMNQINNPTGKVTRQPTK